MQIFLTQVDPLDGGVKEQSVYLSIGQSCKNIMYADGSQSARSILVDHCADALGIRLGAMLSDSHQSGGEYLVLRGVNVQFQFIDNLRRQKRGKLLAQDRQNDFVGRKNDVFDTFFAYNAVEMVDDFFAVAQVEIFHMELISAQPPSSRAPAGRRTDAAL